MESGLVVDQASASAFDAPAAAAAKEAADGSMADTKLCGSFRGWGAVRSLNNSSLDSWPVSLSLRVRVRVRMCMYAKEWVSE